MEACAGGDVFRSESAPDDETIRPGGAPDGAFFSAYVRRTGCFLARGASVGETIRPEGKRAKELKAKQGESPAEKE